MQTFLPVPSYWGSATLLDQQRLGKQRLENMQIMKALVTPEESTPSITKHWVTRLWRGFSASLMDYQEAICGEWVERGYSDTCLEKTRAIWESQWDGPVMSFGGPAMTPGWFGEDEFHRQHRDRLFTKDPVFYSELFPGAQWRDDYDFKWRLS